MLDLSWSSLLAAVADGAFASSQALRTVVFDHSPRLSAVSPTAFDVASSSSPSPSLRQLSFRNCKRLATYPATALPPSVVSFDVTGSVFDCNCSMAWYLDVVIPSPSSVANLASSQTSASSVRTTSPLDESQLSSDETSHRGTAVGAGDGRDDTSTSSSTLVLGVRPYFSDVSCSSSRGPRATRGRLLSSLTVEEMGCGRQLETWQLVAAVGLVVSVISLVGLTFAVAHAATKRRKRGNVKNNGGGEKVGGCMS